MTTTDSRSAATTGEGVNAGLGNPEGVRVDESGTTGGGAAVGAPRSPADELDTLLTELRLERHHRVPPAPRRAADPDWPPAPLRVLAEETAEFYREADHRLWGPS